MTGFYLKKQKSGFPRVYECGLFTIFQDNASKNGKYLELIIFYICNKMSRVMTQMMCVTSSAAVQSQNEVSAYL